MNRIEYLISVDVPPSLEDAVADCLLGISAGNGFVSFAVNAHDFNLQGMSLAEQVVGCKRKIRMQISVDSDGVAVVLNRLKSEFSGSGLIYWVTPVIGYGRI